MRRQWSIRGVAQFVTVAFANEATEDELARATSVDAARWFADPTTRAALVRMDREALSGAPPSSGSVEEIRDGVVARVETAFDRRVLIAFREEKPRFVALEQMEQAPAAIPESKTEEKKGFFSLKVIDEVGDPVDGVELAFTIGGQRKTVKTNGDGVARIDDTTESFASVSPASVAALQDKMAPRWEEPRDKQIDPGPDVHVVVLRDTFDAISLESEIPAKLVLVPPSEVKCVRLIGMHFDLDKSFLLPSAMNGVRRLKEIYDETPGGSVLVVGHTDTSGGAAHNDTLSVERADAVAAFLKDDVDAWKAWFGKDKPDSKRWSFREIQFMLSVLPEDPADGPKFHQGPITGWNDANTQAAVRRFQAFSNEKKGTSLDVDGIAGPATRPEIIRAYMSLDATTLPEGTTLETHGCGEHHPDVETGDGVQSEQNRRVEMFVFRKQIKPPAPGKNSGEGDPTYGKWREQVDETIDFGTGTPPENDLGILFMELFDKDGENHLVGKSYKLIPDGDDDHLQTFSGTIGDDGRLRHENVHAADYTLSIDGVAETAVALVLDRTDTQPQIRFLKV